MKKNLRELIVVVDKSGSMSSIKSDAIGGFNEFLKEQKKSDFNVKMTLVFFDTTYEIVHNRVSVKKVPKLNEETYRPGGGTALYDAIGRAMDEVGDRLAGTKEEKRPEKVLVVILTDGEENSSKEYPYEKISGMIEHQRTKYNWEFIFLAANQDAMAVGSAMNISANLNFASTKTGVKKAYRGIQKLTKAYYSASLDSNFDNSLDLQAELEETQEEVMEGESS